MHPTKKKPIIFTIDIRVSGQNLSIPVYQGENHEQLVRRFCDAHVFQADYKEAIKDKIIESLLETVRKAEISVALRKKVDHFLNSKQKQQARPRSKPKQISKQKQKQKVHSQQKSQRSLKNNSHLSTPFKILGQNHNTSNSQRQNSNTNRHKGAHIQQQFENAKKLQEVQVKKYQKPAAIRKNKAQSSINNSNNNNNKSINPVGKSRTSFNKLQDTDLIQAYETIFRKSKQPHMKSMAKKFLQQCGHFGTNSNSNQHIHSHLHHQAQVQASAQPHASRRLPDPSAQFKKLCKQQNQPGNSNIGIPHNNSTFGYSLTKFQAIDPVPHAPSHKSPERRQKTPPRHSPKKNRIKYDIGDVPVSISNRYGQELRHSKYNTEAINYSLYQNEKSPYRGQRASLSYQRLPYYEVEEERSSFRGSRNVSAGYGNAGEGERAISLRRTRKYKYL